MKEQSGRNLDNLECDKRFHISDKDGQRFIGREIIFRDMDIKTGKVPESPKTLTLTFEDFNSLDLFVEKIKRHRDNILIKSKGERTVRKKLQNIREYVLELEKVMKVKNRSLN